MPNEQSSFEEWADYFKDKLPRNGMFSLFEYAQHLSINHKDFLWRLDRRFCDDGLFNDIGGVYHLTDEGRIFIEHNSYKEYAKDRSIRLKGATKHWYSHPLFVGIVCSVITVIPTFWYGEVRYENKPPVLIHDTVYIKDTVLFPKFLPPNKGDTLGI